MRELRAVIYIKESQHRDLKALAFKRNVKLEELAQVAIEKFLKESLQEEQQLEQTTT